MTILEASTGTMCTRRNNGAGGIGNEECLVDARFTTPSHFQSLTHLGYHRQVESLGTPLGNTHLF